MRKIFLPPLLLVLGLLIPGAVSSAESPQKIRIGFPSPALSALPFYVAKEKGLFQKVGLEVEYIVMLGSIAPQALMNREINFHMTTSVGLAAAASGLPMVVVLSLYKSPPWVLVTSKEINKPQDLIGNKLAISGIRTPPYYFIVAALKKMELDLKQVGLITTGGTSSSFAALTTKQVVGAVLSPPFDSKAVVLGFKRFLFLGDLAPLPYGGLFTLWSEIRENRDRVQKTVGTLLEAVSRIRSNRGESVKMIAEKFNLSQDEAEQSYETLIHILTEDGRLSLKIVRGYLDILRQERPIPADLNPEKLVDFSMLPSAQ